jgi:hypothetical protein
MTDERGDELMYSGVKISEVVESGKGIGGVMALLWFQVCNISFYLDKTPKMHYTSVNFLFINFILFYMTFFSESFRTTFANSWNYV